jgi:hypothetical protein
MHSEVHPYATLAYARTMAHLGRPVHVPAWQTYVIARNWKNGVEDAIGPYPLTCLSGDSDLASGLDQLRDEGLISVVLVVDGLLGPPLPELRRAFTFSRPFKTHYLVDEARGGYLPSKHHRYEIRRATQRDVTVREVPFTQVLDSWTGLYDELIALHRISGVQRFSRDSFEALAQCEGLSAVAAYADTELVSCHLWVRYRGHVWSHLAASSARGYETGAAYAVYDHSIRSFAGNVINLGGSAGIDDAASDGLARFKAGFANRTQTAFLLGGVLDPSTYAMLCAEHGGGEASDYFPAYRAPLANG